MSTGKIASQAGHAFLGAFLAAQATPQGREYAQLSPGTKVTLQGSLRELGRAVERLRQHGIPHYLVIDSGCPDFFDGKPVISALGFGPATKAEVKNITRRFDLL